MQVQKGKGMGLDNVLALLRLLGFAIFHNLLVTSVLPLDCFCEIVVVIKCCWLGL